LSKTVMRVSSKGREELGTALTFIRNKADDKLLTLYRVDIMEMTGMLDYKGSEVEWRVVSGPVIIVVFQGRRTLRDRVAKCYLGDIEEDLITESDAVWPRIPRGDSFA